MSDMIIIALVLYAGVLVFYSLGVLSQNRQKKVKPLHLVFFWLGVVTGVISIIYLSNQIGIHSLSLQVLIAVSGVVWLFIHALWATYILIFQSDKALHQFQEFSLVFWLVWLVPYFTSLLSSLSRQ